jgi:hypothetical protein
MMDSDSQLMERSGEETTEPNEEHAEPVGAPTEQHAIEQQAPVVPTVVGQLCKKRKRPTKIVKTDEVAEDKVEVQEAKKEPSVQPSLDDSRKRDLKSGKKMIGGVRTKVPDRFSIR